MSRCEYIEAVQSRHRHIDPPFPQTPIPTPRKLPTPFSQSTPAQPSVCYSTTPLTFRAMSELRLLLLRLGRALSGGRGTCLAAVHAVSSASQSTAVPLLLRSPPFSPRPPPPSCPPLSSSPSAPPFSPAPFPWVSSFVSAPSDRRERWRVGGRLAGGVAACCAFFPATSDFAVDMLSPSRKLPLPLPERRASHSTSMSLTPLSAPLLLSSMAASRIRLPPRTPLLLP